LSVKQAEALEEAGPMRVLEHLEGLSVPVINPKQNHADLLAELNALTPAPSNLVHFKQVIDLADLTPKPAVLSNGEKLARWIDLDDQVQAGVELGTKDFDFWSMFPQGKTFRELTEDKPDLRQRAANALGKE